MSNLPTIEKRSLHRIGDGGLAVLLPREWARDKGLNLKDRVLVIANNRVVIEPITQERIEEIEKMVDEVSQGEKSNDE